MTKNIIVLLMNLYQETKLTKKILEQMEKDGTNHVWLDMKPVIKKGIDIKKRFPNIVKKCLEEGYDVEKECIPVVPAQHYFMGGIEVDPKQQDIYEKSVCSRRNKL